jgi:osmotically-inducible protein OsmY
MEAVERRSERSAHRGLERAEVIVAALAEAATTCNTLLAKAEPSPPQLVGPMLTLNSAPVFIHLKHTEEKLMGFSDFWRGGRDRSHRNENRSQDTRAQNEDRGFGRPNYPRDEAGFERRGWRQGSDYYGNNAERYGQRGSQGEDFNARPEYQGGGDDWRNRAGYGDDYSRGESSFNDRWQSAYGPGISSYGRDRSGSSDDWGSRNADQDRAEDRWWNEVSGRPGGGINMVQQTTFRGRGPRGYRRSDERIHEDVCECLTDDERIDASNISIEVKDCEVTLTGTVNSRDEKRRAEDLIDQLSGVRDIHNSLRVVNEGGRIEGAGNPGEQNASSQATQSDQTIQGARH